MFISLLFTNIAISVKDNRRLVIPIKRSFIQIRTMQNSRNFIGYHTTNLVRRHSYPFNIRAYKAITYVDPHNLRTENNSPLTQHEITHTIVASDDFKIGLGLLTSAKKPKTGFTPTIIDNVNYLGQNKSQSFAPFRYPRALPAEFIQENPLITNYITQREVVFHEILTKVPRVPSIKIVYKRDAETPKDDEIFTK